MATRYTFTDDSNDVRISGFLTPEPAGTFNGGTITEGLEVAPSAAPTTLAADLVVDTASLVADGNAVLLLEGPSGLLVEWDSNGGYTHVVRSATAWQILDDLAGVSAFIAIPNAGGTMIGLYGHAAAAQPTLTSGTATPEQIALALQSYGAAGGT